MKINVNRYEYSVRVDVHSIDRVLLGVTVIKEQVGGEWKPATLSWSNGLGVSPSQAMEFGCALIVASSFADVLDLNPMAELKSSDV